MALTRLSKTLLGTFTAAAIGIGTLAGATTATAAPAEQTTAQTITIKAVNNLGLNTTEAKSVQCYVRDAVPVGAFDPGAIDGQLGTKSWKAWQLFLNDRGFNAGTVDGVVGPNTISGLQRFLVAVGYDTGGIDGIDGPKTKAAWKAFANSGGGWADHSRTLIGRPCPSLRAGPTQVPGGPCAVHRPSLRSAVSRGR